MCDSAPFGFEISRGGGGGGGAKHFQAPPPPPKKKKETLVQSLHSGYILAVCKEVVEMVEK